MFTIKNPNEPTTYEKLAQEVGRVGMFNNSVLKNGECRCVAVKDDAVLAFHEMVSALFCDPDRLFWRSENGDLWEIVWNQEAADRRAAWKAKFAELTKDLK